MIAPLRSPEGRLRTALVAIAAAVVASRWLLRAQVPDDNDSLDFVLAIARGYDLSRLQPHFPGYPVYVALGAALHRIGFSPIDSLTAISAFSAGLSAIGLALCAQQIAGPFAAIGAAALHAVAFLPWLLGGAALSDGLGTALAISAFALLSLDQPRPVMSAFVAGLVLGVRLSYWPIVIILLLFAAHHSRARTAAGFSLGLLLWAIPFFAIVGVREFIAVGQTHVAGHFTQWGGSVATRPDFFSRLAAFLRGLFFDGLAPSPLALSAIAIALGTGLWLRPRNIQVATIFVVLIPYALWTFFAQNVIEQPRHLLPIVEGALLIVACLLASAWPAILAIIVVASWINVPLLLERHRTPPAVMQAAAWLDHNADPTSAVLFAGRHGRYLQSQTPRLEIRERAWVSEVIADLSRFDRLPATVLLTSEIDLHSGGDASSPMPPHWRLEQDLTFCRDPRIDRAGPCLGVSRLLWISP